MPDEPLTFGPFRLNLANGTLFRSGELVEIGQKGALLLGALLQRRGDVLTKAELMDAVWPGTSVEESNLSVQIASLRKLLGPAPGGGEWIMTVPRVGYRFIAEPQDKASKRVAEAPEPDGPIPRIVVLPFVNLGGDAEQDYFADGLVDDLITGLSRFRTFSVVARSSAFAFKGRAVDSRQTAKDLGVRYLLEGSIRRSADRIRINTQLIEGTTGVHIWVQQFDGELANFFDFQDEITMTVIGLIEPQIHRAEIERVRQKRPDSLQAWDLYVQAVPLVHSAKVADYDPAIDLLDRAIAIDPYYAPALTFASWAHERRRTYGGTSPDGEDDTQIAFDLIQRAVAADPDDALALTLLGWERILFQLDEAGLESCERGVALNPNNRAVLDLACVAHLFAGDLDKCIVYAKRAIDLSPGASDNYACANHIATAHYLSRRFEEACQWARRSIQMDRGFAYSHLGLSISLAHLGRLDEAKKELNIARSIWPGVLTGWREAAGVRQGRWAAADEGLQILNARSE